MKTIRTKTLPVKYKDMLNDYGSAGPNPNISGMKQNFWGNDAYTVKCGSYVYFLGRYPDEKAMHIYNDLAH